MKRAWVISFDIVFDWKLEQLFTVFWTFEENNFDSKFSIIFWTKYWRNFSGLFCRLHMESYCRNIVWTKFLHNILYQIINTSRIYDQLKSKDPNPAKSGSIKHKVHNSISINKELARFSLVHTKLNLELWFLFNSLNKLFKDH